MSQPVPRNRRSYLLDLEFEISLAPVTSIEISRIDSAAIHYRTELEYVNMEEKVTRCKR